MPNTSKRALRRKIRHRRIRKRVFGEDQRPRLSVFRSHKHMYVQLIDDVSEKTLLGCSTKDERLNSVKQGGNINAAIELGRLVADEAKKKGISKVVFDRGGYIYHGRIKAFADAVREGGLNV